jgi:RecB family endonuclease NucS
MNFTNEEIDLIRFCGDNIDCAKEECPVGNSCEEGKEICLAIPSKMERGMELSPTDKEIILYFFKNEKQQQLWKRNSCTPKGTKAECPNVKACDDREKERQKCICDELLDKLGLYSKEEYQILEREIQKVIINNLQNIDWGVGEKLQYYAHESPIDIGRADILLQSSKTETLYVIELKPAQATREDVGQLQSYVGWYKENIMPKFKIIKGILLAKELDDGAKYAIKANPDLEARLFRLHIEVTKQ